VTRAIGRLVSEQDLALVEISLTIGPTPMCEHADDELEAGWALLKEKIMSNARRDGSRPWAWWRFEAREDPPPMEPGAEEVRLAELGELTDEEVEAIARRAAAAEATLASGICAYVATGAGRRISFERDAIDRWERVERALGR
jgi:hypothetical protein